MANRLFEFNNTVTNGLVFVDPANLNHRANVRQVFWDKNSSFGKYQMVRGSYSQVNSVAFSPNAACQDDCKTISVDGKLSFECSYPVNVPYETKSKEFDAFVANLTANKERLLTGRQLALNASLIAEIIP